ncbi:MAG: hypothetical protein WC766_02965 [Patescibacteria group bacterium]|jgi:hypothetical protein
MPALKPRSKSTRSKKVANSPVPSKMSACGHSHCEDVCRVRYIGPVSSIRDHHIMHVARGMSHIWTAAIIAGLAVVLTGAVAFSAVNASNQQRDDVRTAESTGVILNKMDDMQSRLDVLEREVGQVSADGKTAANVNTVFPEQR